MIIYLIFILDKYLINKKNMVQLYCIKKYGELQIININKIINNTDYEILYNLNKSSIISRLINIFTFHLVLFNTITEYVNILISLFIMILYYLYLENFQVIFFIIIIGICLYYNFYNEEKIKNKFNVKKYTSTNISFKLNEFYQDIFNISINSSITTIDNFNLDFIYDLKNRFFEKKFIVIYDDISEIIILTLCFVIIFLFNNYSISSIEIIIIIKYITSNINNFILSKQRLHNYIIFIYDMLNIYNLEQRKSYPQFKIENDQNILINKLNIKINKNFELKINKSIILKPSQLYLIRGKSGCGKTTFVKTIRCINHIDPNDIEIVVNDTIYDLNSITSNIYYVDQFTKLYKNGNIYQIISGFNDLYLNDESTKIINDLVEISGLNNLKNDIIYINKISGGQMYRLSICKALFQSMMQNKRLIIMDEIDASIDIETTERILKYIKKSLYGSTILYISHKEHIQNMGFPIININNGMISLEE
jgi:ABC-type multidrug transport system ATPase subunit